MVEFLLTVHVLTDDNGLKDRTVSELLCVLSRIMEEYADRHPSETADSHTESTRSPARFNDSSWENLALELRSQVNTLQAQVAALSERLATIRSSKVYRSLVKARNLLNAIAPGKTTS
jgi:hypothetical protein